jgi:hypothetical protein
VLSSAVWCCAVQRGAVQCSVVLSSAVWCCAVQRGAVRCCAMLYGAVQCCVVRYSAAWRYVFRFGEAIKGVGQLVVGDLEENTPHFASLTVCT